MSFSKFTFYYITPLFLGFISGICFRDSISLNISKKISMSLADYYEKIDEEVDTAIKTEFIDVENLIKKSKRI